MPAPATLFEQLSTYGQEHVLTYWDDLSSARQEALAEQLTSVDCEQLATLFGGEEQQYDWAEAARRAEPPVAMRLADRQAGRGGGLGVTPSEAIAQGKAALDAGKVGVVLVAGGQGSRLGFDRAKGIYAIGPVSEASLLQIHLEKAVALAKRHGHGVPVYLMTSPVTHDEQVIYLRDHHRFGLAEEDLFFFCQGTMPAVDAVTGKLLLSDKGSLFLSPDGHGGAVAAMSKSGAFEHMREHGVELLFYLQVDNPLVPIGDAELLGYHLATESELSSMAVTKESPQEKVGNFATIDGALHVIEYSDFPTDVAEQTDPDGGLRFWAGSIAVHVMSVDFLQRSAADAASLPFHRARKKVPHLDAHGACVEPTEPNALKFERFIFDLLPKAKNPIVVEYEEREVFAPLKNAEGAPKDTPSYVQRFLLDQHRRWLTAAGAKLPPDAPVEISPLWALDAAAVAERAKGLTIDGPTYLR